MLSALRDDVRRLLALTSATRPAALRRADDDAFLLACDLPLCADADAVAAFVRALNAQGWTVVLRGGWLYLSHDIDAPVDVPFPHVLHGEAGCCLSLLLRHPSDQPAPAEHVRGLAKAEEAGLRQVERLCGSWHHSWAEKLRLHEPLPSGLIPYLAAICGKESSS